MGKQRPSFLRPAIGAGCAGRSAGNDGLAIADAVPDAEYKGNTKSCPGH